jgi:CO/xanthine dehydrogenase Mo-binding subunit
MSEAPVNYIDADLKVVGTRPIRPDGVDKVTGRAVFAADTRAARMLWGRIKRSPHAHARILSIDASKAEALPGVTAVLTAADLPNIPSEEAFVGEGPMNFRDLSRNIMARDKALYEGHAVAAVAATTPGIASQALDLIEVVYEVLPFVIDAEEAMAPDAPVLHEDLFTAGVDPKPTKPSNVAKVVKFSKGDVEAGFAEADVIVEGHYTTQPVHQGYIEPHACLATYAPDGQVTIHASSQGHFMIRAYTSKLLGIDIANIKVSPAEIGGGFGGKTLIYLEPVAVMLSKKSGRPVKISDDAGGSVPWHRPDLRCDRGGEDRREARRFHRRRAAGAQVPGRRIPRLTSSTRLHVRVRTVRPAECRCHRL